MNLNVKIDVARFLGVLIKRIDNNKIELTQIGLIKQIIEAMGIVGSNPKATPAETEALPAKKQGDPTESSFNYVRIVGMLQYLQGHTRSDISFVVSQCSCYIHQHTNMHINALKSIGRYLLQSSEKGIILQPASEISINCYLDADFVELWN